MLPDASTGQGPGTLAEKLSRCKEGMARVFAVQVQILLSITSVAVQGLLRAGSKSMYTKFYREQVRGPDLSRFTKLSKWQKVSAKTVTNLLILLSVLALVIVL